MNMMMVAIIFGILVAHIYNELFFVCILIGFVLSLLLLRYVLSLCFRSFGGRAGAGGNDRRIVIARFFQ